ncbi:MAG: hypothetical protein K0R05_1846 [Anaerocolumna sp.]|jgi:hypothetical protein|nr:hypothetical protein [Anaerocolumna sp.]
MLQPAVYTPMPEFLNLSYVLYLHFKEYNWKNIADKVHKDFYLCNLFMNYLLILFEFIFYT